MWLLVAGQTSRGAATLDLLLDPLPLLRRLLDVHVNSTPMVRQCASRRDARILPLTGAPAHRPYGPPLWQEEAVEVPDGQTMAGDVEIVVTTLFVLQRVGCRPIR